MKHPIYIGFDSLLYITSNKKGSQSHGLKNPTVSHQALNSKEESNSMHDNRHPH